MAKQVSYTFPLGGVATTTYTSPWFNSKGYKKVSIQYTGPLVGTWSLGNTSVLQSYITPAGQYAPVTGLVAPYVAETALLPGIAEGQTLDILSDYINIIYYAGFGTFLRVTITLED
jgi:hypothetical protein